MSQDIVHAPLRRADQTTIIHEQDERSMLIIHLHVLSSCKIR